MASSSSSSTTTTTIKTPLLRTFAAYYGHIGYQFLGPVHLGRPWSGVLNLGLNIAIFIAVSTHLFLNDPWKTKSLQVWTTDQNPFVGLIAGSLTNLVLPVLMQSVMLYYFFTGRRLIALLDNEHYFSVYRNFNPLLLFLPLLAGLLTVSLLINPNNIFSSVVADSSDSSGGSGSDDGSATWWSSSTLNWAVVLVQATSFHNNYLILHYCQHGNRVCLEKFEAELLTNLTDQSSVKDRKLFYYSLRHLALLNHQLISVLSTPLTLSLAITLLSNVSIVCIALVLESTTVTGTGTGTGSGGGEHLNTFLYLNMLYTFAGYLYLLYLAALNRKVVETFERIIISSSSSRQLSSVCSVIETELYAHCFSIRLFRLTVISPETLLSAALFGLCLVVFIFQTK